MLEPAVRSIMGFPMAAHTCDAIIICCIDFRFQKYIRDWTDKNLTGKSFDLVGFAGATKTLDTVLEQIRISVRLHRINRVVLIHHEDCGAYGKLSTRNRHARDLHLAQKRILSEFPDLRVDLYYLYLDGEFEEILPNRG